MPINECFYELEKSFTNKYINNINRQLEEETKINNNKFVTYKNENTYKMKNFINKIAIIRFLFLIIIVDIIQEISTDSNYIYIQTTKNLNYLYIHNLRGFIYSHSANSISYYDDNTVRFYLNNRNNLYVYLYSGINNVSQMFKNNNDIKSVSIYLTGAYSSNIQYANEMFENSIFLESIYFVYFETTNIVNMSRMFYNCLSVH